MPQRNRTARFRPPCFSLIWQSKCLEYAERYIRLERLTKQTAAAGPLGRSTMSPLFVLTKQGQSVWLDYIRRSFLTSGDFKRLIEEDGVRGVTSGLRRTD
jgi:hypothetical protein